MRRVVPFTQILEERLAAAAAASDAEPARRGSVAPQVLGFFDFSAPGRQPTAWRPGTFRWRAATPAGSPQPQPRRIPRYLTGSQRAALNELVALGAMLAADFTDAELRAAFRDLARQYHPDRHPGSSEEEKARLSAQFARAHASYRLLQSAALRAA